MAAAVFQRNDKYLVCRKKAGLPNGGQWEFPGGKRKPAETFTAALIREISEELNVSIEVGRSLGCSFHETGTAIIELHCFIVSEWHGDFNLTDHDALRWCSIKELETLQLSDADVPFIERIKLSV